MPNRAGRPLATTTFDQATRVHWRDARHFRARTPQTHTSCSTAGHPVRILVDADACPVKEQIYRVAARYTLPVLIVANAPMRVPSGADVGFVHVPGGLDAVDDWIAEAATADDIVTTADIPLAGRVVEKGAVCI